MEGRVIVIGFVVSVGFVFGWVISETISGALFVAAFALVIFVIDWLVDDYIYEWPW